MTSIKQDADGNKFEPTRPSTAPPTATAHISMPASIGLSISGAAPASVGGKPADAKETHAVSSTTDTLLNKDDSLPIEDESRSAPVDAVPSKSPHPDSADYQDSPPAKDAFIICHGGEPYRATIVNGLIKSGVTVYDSNNEADRVRRSLQMAACESVIVCYGNSGWADGLDELLRQAVEIEKVIIPVVFKSALSDDDYKVVPTAFFEHQNMEFMAAPTTDSIRQLATRIVNLQGQTARQDVGATSNFTRETHPDDAVLNAHEYADVLASLICLIGDDNAGSLAIFAPWGRGKTSLMRMVGSRLAQRSYTTVFFSAWKYRTTPELWSYLYETFYLNAAKSSWAVPVRAGLLRHGIWPVVPLLLSIAFSLSTISQKLYLASFTLSLFGVFGVLYLIGVSRAFWNAGEKIRAAYMNLPRHHDRLGLQFAIGEDLRTLLMGWLPNATGNTEALKAVFAREPLSTLCYFISAAAVWWTATEAAAEKASGSLLAGLSVVMFLGISLTVALLPAWALVRKVDSKDRVLLVVDDLDRCHPDQMLEVIECLQLFLDDNDVKKRLTVVMLVEEDILRAAVQEKYSSALNRDIEENKRLVNQIVDENLEKLFLVWLRLEPLESNEIGAVFRSVCQSMRGSTVVSEGKSDRAGDASSSEKQIEEVAITNDEQAKTPKTPIPGRKVDETLSGAEGAAFLKMVDKVIQTSNRRWSPRAVRSFVFRYQLARMLLDKLEIDWNTKEVVLAIAAAHRDSTVPPVGVKEAVFRVARQVS